MFQRIPIVMQLSMARRLRDYIAIPGEVDSEPRSKSNSQTVQFTPSHV